MPEIGVLAYHWARAQGWLLVGAYPGGAVMPIPKHRYLAPLHRAGRTPGHRRQYPALQLREDAGVAALLLAGPGTCD